MEFGFQFQTLQDSFLLFIEIAFLFSPKVTRILTVSINAQPFIYNYYFRYPESKNGKQYKHLHLICNGDDGIKLFKQLYESIKDIKILVLNEYHRLCP